jgi:hypothetical protein
MDFDLKDFASTLAAGGYAFLAIGLVVYLARGLRPIALLYRNLRKRKWTIVSLVTISCFILGIFVEDTSDEYYANRPGWLWWIPEQLGLSSEEELKADVLFKESGRLTSLGKDLHALGTLPTYADHNDRVDAAKKLYYLAKGVVYCEDNYYDEMQRIQLRINFVRSIALVSLLGAYACVPLILWALLRKRRKMACNGLGAFVFFALLMGLGHRVFAIEEQQFNARAFGYWATMEEAKQREQEEPSVLPDVSGMARLSPRSFVVVHDRKSDDPRARLGCLYVDQKHGVHYRSFEVDWDKVGGPASDLESICPIPGREGEYLAAESSHWKGRTGRLFHLVVDATWCRVEGKIPLPEIKNIEGIACVVSNEEEVAVLLGERAPESGKGKLHRAVLNLSDYTLGEVSPIEFELTNLPKMEGLRVCSDLYLEDETFWVSAAVDPDVGTGPFASFVYELVVSTSNAVAKEPTWRLDGLKVEALGPSAVDGSELSVATDDEDFGGIWRPLPRR